MKKDKEKAGIHPGARSGELRYREEEKRTDRTTAVETPLWARSLPPCFTRAETPAPPTPSRHDWRAAQPIGCSVVNFSGFLKLEAQRAVANWTPIHASCFLLSSLLCLCPCELVRPALLHFFLLPFFSSSSLFLSPSVSCSLCHSALLGRIMGSRMWFWCQAVK